MFASEILQYLPTELRDAIKKNPGCEEIRLRAGKTAALYADREIRLPVVYSQSEIEEIVRVLSGYSLSTKSDDIKKGFISAAGGVRVGIAGKVTLAHGKIDLIRDFTSVCIRFPKDIKKIGNIVKPYILKNGRYPSVIIISPPRQGKTTLLRDLIRTASEDGFNCVAVDEREEISGGGAYDLGDRTDVLLGCPKQYGLNIAVRTLSPDIVATDESGGEEDINAARDARSCGVSVFTTLHAEDMHDALSRFPDINKVFKCAIVLSGRLGRSTVEQIYMRAEPLLKKPIFLRGE